MPDSCQQANLIIVLRIATAEHIPCYHTYCKAKLVDLRYMYRSAEEHGID
jgi:hypothetical protein